MADLIDDNIIYDQFLLDQTDTEARPERITIGPPNFKKLEQTRQSLEKMRVGVGNRLSALTRGTDELDVSVVRVYETIDKRLRDSEIDIEELMSKRIEDIPVWNYWLKHVKGIGPGLAAQLCSMLLIPLPDRGPSTWYRAAGLNAELRPDGLYRLPKPRTGEGKITYHPYLRRCLWNTAKSFVRVGGDGYYRGVYDQQKKRLAEKHQGDENWPLHRLDSAARWATIKLFLSHLWEMELESRGLTGRQAYVVEVLGHHYVPPPRWSGNGKL